MKTEELLEKLISIPSTFPHEEEISQYLQKHLGALGFTVQVILTEKNRPNIIATYGKAKKYLGFYGHIDTVDPGEKRKTSSLKMVIKNGKAYGLGVADMKAGVAAILQAGEFAIKNRLPLKIMLGVDEEGISEGAHDLASSKLMDDISFLIVGESGQAASLKQGCSLCYGRKGRILFEITVVGKKAHAAESEKGINAVEKAGELLTEVKKIQFPIHHQLGQAQFITHAINGETDSFSLPESCKIYASLLTTPEVSSKNFISQVKVIAKEKNINITMKPAPRKTPYGESYEVDKNDKFLKTLEKEIFIKYAISPSYATSVADENVFANKLQIPVITLGPIGGGDHTADEWLDLQSLTMVENLYKKIIKLHTSKQKLV